MGPVRALLVASAALALIAPVAAPAQPGAVQAGAPAPDLEGVIGRLGSEDLDARLAADGALRKQGIRLADIESAVKRVAGPLSPEARQRLLDIGWEHFRAEPRAAMGIRSNWSNGRGVTVDGLTAGFPAASLLKAGDRIESADGVKLDQFNTLRMVILSHDPGDEMSLRILRDGAVLTLAVPLGSFSNLPERFPDDFSLKQAWTDHRASRMLSGSAGGEGEPLASGVALPIWARADEEAPEDEPLPTVVQAASAQNDDRTSLVVGGEPRGGVTPVVIDATTASRNRRLTPDLQGLQAMRAQNEQMRMLVQVLGEQRRALEADVQATTLQLADPRIPEERKKPLRQALAEKRATLELIENEIRRSQALINRR